MKKIKGWKNINKDMKCRDFLFELGKSYHQKGKIEICGNGFHFHESSIDIFKYYDRESLVVEVEATGDIVTGDDKSVCSDIKIIRLVPDEEVEKICNLLKNIGLHNTGYRNTGDSNTGDWNTGDSNTGDSNTGYRNTGHSNTGDWNTGHSNTGESNTGESNTGDWNTGDRNTGYRNTGDWNTSDKNTGFFNTNKVKSIMVFNKPCSLKKWENTQKPDFVYHVYLTEWISDSSMSDQEKINNPSFRGACGYLKEISWKNAWKTAWENKNNGDIELLEKLPNFSWRIFTKITGIKKPK